MIHIRVWRRDHRPIRYRVTGHAGAGPHGEDIVCAAVSALTQTTLIGIEEHLGIQPVVIYDETGILEVELPPLQEESRLEQGCTDLLETMLLGLESIARSHPGHVRVEQHDDLE